MAFPANGIFSLSPLFFISLFLPLSSHTAGGVHNKCDVLNDAEIRVESKQ